AADLDSVQTVGLNVRAQQPCPRVVVIAGISSAADYRTAPVADADIVVQIQSPSRSRSFHKSADEMDRNKVAAKLHHLRAADRCLQPLTVVISSVPVVDRRMKASE